MPTDRGCVLDLRMVCRDRYARGWWSVVRGPRRRDIPENLPPCNPGIGRTRHNVGNANLHLESRIVAVPP